MPEREISYPEFSKALDRITAVEAKLEKTVTQINASLTSSKNFDGNLEKRVGDLDTRVTQIRDHLNVILQKAKDYDSGLDKRLTAVEARMDQTRDRLNVILQKAKDFDTGLATRLVTVESSVKDLKRTSATDNTLSKSVVATMIESNAKELDRALSSQIKELRKQVDTVARSNKR
jgi:hypothetical protein